ncbi:hypothetical protein LXA43DRAFT_1114924, partial [Ganoderma leucocontextum]
MSYPCKGCDGSFARHGDLLQHLRRTTTRPACIQANEVLLSSIRRPIPDEDPQDTVSAKFEGDYFGAPEEYGEADFPFGDDEALAQDLDEEDDEMDEAVGLDALEPDDGNIPPPTPPSPPQRSRSPEAMDEDPPHTPGPSQREVGQPDDGSDGIGLAAQEHLRNAPAHVRRFGGRAGEPTMSPKILVSGYQGYASRVSGSADNPYAPFNSRLDWEIARWGKLRGPSSTSLTELLQIQGVAEALGLSFKTAKQLDEIVDDKIPLRRPVFVRHQVSAQGEKSDFYARDLIACIRALYGDAEHARYLVFVPERHYADEDNTIRLYHDLHTGQWWWQTQKAVEAESPGATIIPIIISSDKTQITLFRNKSAYPVYLTIGNLPKSIRRKPSRQGQILLAYLPTTRLDHITNKAARRRVLANLFHACMSFLLEPLKEAGKTGIPMMSGDGVWRRCHPILAVYVGDYPEQCLVAGAYNGDCPVCDCTHDELGTFPCAHEYRDLDLILDALLHPEAADFTRKCRDANVKPIQHPFWIDLPYTDIYQSITPDVLHQLYQGVFKHLLSWLKDACGAAEIDARASRLPPNHGVRIFWKGITKLARVSGAEHKQISRFLLGLVVDMPLPDPDDRTSTARLVRATRSLLEFLNLAQYPVHTDDTLASLDAALASFHEVRDIFVDLGVRSGFDIPKLHFLLHYVRFIKLFGTTDNYNTEATERLHIDFAKDAYRATNHKDEYPQMTKWLERREKLLHHSNYVLWRLQQAEIGPATLSAHQCNRWEPPDLASPLYIKMTKHPTRKAVPLDEIISRSHYGATFFIPAFARFVVQHISPALSLRQIEDRARFFRFPFSSLPVYHRIKFWNEAIFGTETLDSIHVHPRQSSTGSEDIVIPARFDTALVDVRPNGENTSADGNLQHGLDGMRIAQVRVVFTIPDRYLDKLFPGMAPADRPPRHLAYVEWFTKFNATPDRDSKLHKVTWAKQNGARIASVIPVSALQRSVHLIPKWGGPVPSHWTSENILDECKTFYMNSFKDSHTYFNLY